MNTRNPSRILVIDDENFFLDLLAETLSGDYQVSLAKNALAGLARANGRARPDLILLDISMPGMDGYQTIVELKKNPLTRDIPVIFLTARQRPEDELRGFELGAADYITKPISLPVLHARVRTQLAISRKRSALEELVRERTRELECTKDAIVFSMGEMAEARDQETGRHLLRCRAYVRLLAEQLARLPDYSQRLNEKVIDAFARAAPLHDIGKIAVPEAILRKPGPLSDEEWVIMRQHPEQGRRIIDRAEKQIGSTQFIQVAREIAWAHHEKWDGSGYPRGLKGEEIPLAARLMAVADVYDALISKRCYKEAQPHEIAVQSILEGSGSHFDPLVIDAFAKTHERFDETAQRLKDDESNGDGSGAEPPSSLSSQHIPQE